MSEYLTTAEFVRWADQFDKKLDEMKQLRDDVTSTKIDVALLKAQHSKAKGINSTLSAIVAGIVSAIVSYSGAK